METKIRTEGRYHGNGDRNTRFNVERGIRSERGVGSAEHGVRDAEEQNPGKGSGKLDEINMHYLTWRGTR